MTERPAVAAQPMPESGRLTERQLLGIDCAHCGAYLGAQALRLGEIEDHDYVFQLFGCDPTCVRLPRRLPGRSWRSEWDTTPTAPAPPSPARVRPTGARPWRGSPLDRLPRWTTATENPAPPPGSFDNSEATIRRVVTGLRALLDAGSSDPP